MSLLGRRVPIGPGTLTVLLALLTPSPARGDVGASEVAAGPASLAVRGGSQNDSATGGLDGRLDLLTGVVNVHLFGTYEALDSSHGPGLVESRRYGGGLALSHTFIGRASIYAGAAAVHELDLDFAHAYAGFQVAAGRHALVSAAYGVGLGDPKRITRLSSPFASAESVDWGRLGVVFAGAGRWRGSLHYDVGDPGDVSLSGVQGELACAVTERLTFGVAGRGDVTEEDDIDRNWRGYLYLAWGGGESRTSMREAALARGQVAAYPVVLRSFAPAARAGTGLPLTISPQNATNDGCGVTGVVFTASGGVPPYTWSQTSGLGAFTPDYQGDNTMALWEDSPDDYCAGGGTVTIQVMDSVGDTAVATINVIGGT